MKTYIKNYGITQSYIKKNNKQTMNELKWKADYDGNMAHLDLNILTNGKKDHINMTLDNDDLMRMLNNKTVGKPIDQRLRSDFFLKDFSLKNKKTRKPRRKAKRNSTKSRKNITSRSNSSKTISL